jgi:hypothetical protein
VSLAELREVKGWLSYEGMVWEEGRRACVAELSFRHSLLACTSHLTMGTIAPTT